MSEPAAKTVLIVDNDKTVRDTMSQIVQRMGYECLSVERATRAAAIITEEKVDAMLLDLHMPGPHGDHLLAHLKRRSVPIPPTIVVSGYLHEDRIGPLLEFGISGIIAKPFEVKRLMDELTRILEGEEVRSYRYCPQCGTPSQLEDQFCRRCACSLQRELACAKCGKACEPGDRFCGGCGSPLAADAAPPTSADGAGEANARMP